MRKLEDMEHLHDRLELLSRIDMPTGSELNEVREILKEVSSGTQENPAPMTKLNEADLLRVDRLTKLLNDYSDAEDEEGMLEDLRIAQDANDVLEVMLDRVTTNARIEGLKASKREEMLREIGLGQNTWNGMNKRRRRQA